MAGTGLRRAVGERLGALPLSTRLVAVVTGLLVVALLLTGAVTTALLQRVLVAQIDDDLRGVSRDPNALRGVVFASQDRGPGGVPSEYLVQLTAADGTVLERLRSPNQGEVELESITLARAKAEGGEPFTLGGDVRGVAVPARLQDGQVGVVTIAQPLAPVERAVSAVAAWFVLVGALVVVACATLGAAAVRRAFRPLREVEAVATAFGGGDTSRRVDAAPPTTEVGRLGRSVNAMLDRIETSLAAREASENRMRRFVADASHELRTPLAAVRGFAELHRIGAVTGPEEVDVAFRRIETEAVRMGGLVDDLLLLARLDEQRPMAAEPVDLLVLAADARHDAGALAPDRDVDLVGPVDGAPPAPAPVVGDDARLRQVLGNLLANALRHTPAGSPVQIGVGVREGPVPLALLRVVDHGPGVPAEDAERVFERFFRADPSRARHQGGGSGLGLAIVAAIVTAHGGAVRLVPTPGGGATAEVVLPLADGPDGGRPQAVDDGGAPSPPGPSVEGERTGLPGATGPTRRGRSTS